MTRQLLSLAIRLPADVDVEAAVDIARMAGRLGFSAIHLCDVGAIAQLARPTEAAAPALVVADLPVDAAGVVPVNDPELVARTRASMDAEGHTRPLLVSVPISIGRTMNEAAARADLETRFAGPRHPREIGIFGTFEQAQAQVLALAGAGADGLVLDIPISRDVADVLAQIRALVVGATLHLADGAGRTRDVPAPRTVFYGN